MYPNLYFFIKDTFGTEPWAWTKFVNAFGFFVAIAFILSAMVLAKELKRKEREGLLFPVEENIIIGKPASLQELLMNALLGFLVGYKAFGIFLNSDQIPPQEYIFSAKGSWGGGIILALVFAGLKYREKAKQKLAKPEKRKIRIWPHERVGDITIYAAIFGFIGAKLFDNFENWDRFIQNPIENLLSPSGLTFYGGLICATIAILWYARKKKISIRHLVDAAAPTLMLAYALGRIGCQVSGDGDWGILNSAYVTSASGKAIEAGPGDFEKALNTHKTIYLSEFGTDSIPRIPVKAPSFLPTWTVAYPYPHNVNEQGFQIAGCEGDHCNALPVPVFPTPFYEIIICLILFLVLMALRKKITIPGQMFAIYLVLNGLERFFIEKIRVNTKYDLLGFHPTQAEIISTLMIIAGIALFFYAKRNTGSAIPAKA
ncbi:prolipoprotein diacylglyceryl transferase family protein [Agriterribacter sp.]|uniref:prolipoprotein diacylglyceryl transferase n=1 Tax=Agriterribacter sp. TaxID=2821509 RepID=UPI002C140429|nr:prolipoprotein diacylglyceryl transferase family protein [Agriterribacter sp.]HRO46972.1 prolipoprotein diacylglyceryl transferase [Agriterribacter sp.]HRQ19494.1 prolipoprotein diacylglyceryl transferase [Agriterribacter sp.]